MNHIIMYPCIFIALRHAALRKISSLLAKEISEYTDDPVHQWFLRIKRDQIIRESGFYPCEVVGIVQDDDSPVLQYVRFLLRRRQR